MLSSILLSILLVGVHCSSSTLPEWKDLECQPGHKYLFSDITHNWEDSMGECELYGGWLVQINDLKEYNCLLRYGAKEIANEYLWFWTDGKSVDGVWTHGTDGTDMSFFAPRISCGCSHCTNSDSGDAFIVQDTHITEETTVIALQVTFGNLFVRQKF